MGLLLSRRCLYLQPRTQLELQPLLQHPDATSSSSSAAAFAFAAAAAAAAAFAAAAAAAFAAAAFATAAAAAHVVFQRLPGSLARLWGPI